MRRLGARYRRLVALSAAAAGVLGSMQASRAGTYDWDADGAPPASGNDTGTPANNVWDTTSPRWNDPNSPATDIAWPNTAADVARFAGNAGTVNLGAPITAGGLTFNVDGYTIANGGVGANTLTLNANSTITVTNATDTATISAVLTGNATTSFNGVNTASTTAFVKAGDGTLSLTGTNTFPGDVVINAGTVRVANANGLSTFNPPAGSGGTPAASGSTANPATRVILNGANAQLLVDAGYDANAGSSFDEFLFTGVGGAINVTSGTLLLNDAGQFGDLTGGTSNASTIFKKAGAGTVQLAKAFTFSGSVLVTDGKLILSSDNGDLGTGTNAITINGGTVDLQITPTGTKTYTIQGTGFNNSGALIASTGAGVAGAITLTGSASVGGNGQLTLGAITESPASSGFSLTKIGTGLTILNASDGYTGNTIITGGTLRDTTGTSLPNTSGTLLGNVSINNGVLETRGTLNNALGTGANQFQFTGGGTNSAGLSANGATLAVNFGGSGAELTWGASTFNPGTLVLNGTTAANALTLANGLDLASASRTISTGANTATINGLIRTASGTAGLTKTGAGTLILGNTANSYNGVTSINAGVLSGAVLTDTGNSSFGTGNITFTGAGTLQYTGTAATTLSTRTVTVGAQNATFDVPNATTGNGLELNQTITGNNANTLTKTGNGIFTLSGTGDNASVILNATGGTTLLNKASASGIHAVAGISNISSGATVRIASTATGGDQIYGGNATSTAGLVNIGGGTLDLNAASEGLARLTGFGTITNSAVAGTTSTLTLGETNATGSSYAGAINDGASGGKVAVVKTGTGTQSLSGTSNFTGGLSINQGTVTSYAPTDLGNGTVSLNGGTLSIAGGTVSGFGVNGTGYTLNGGPTVTSDALTITTAAGSLARTAYFNNKVDVRSFNTSFHYVASNSATGADGFTFVLQNQGLTAVGGSGGSKGYAGITPSVAIIFNIYNQDNAGVGSNGALNNLQAATNTISLDNVDITATYNGTQLSFAVNGVAVGSPLTVNIPSILGSNSAFMGFTGGTGGANSVQTISNFSYTPTLAPVAYTAPMVVQPGTTSGLDLTGPSTITLGTLSIGSGSTLNVTGASTGTNATYAMTVGATALSGAATINVANNGAGLGTLVVGDVTGGSNALTKGGPGTLNLAGAGTSTTGTLSATAGVLAINTTLTASSVSIQSGATLGGSGTITGPITIASGGTVAPGNSPGVLKLTGNGGSVLSMTTGSTYAVDIGPSNAPGDPNGVDQIKVLPGSGSAAGDITITGATLSLTEFNGGPTAGNYVIIDNGTTGATFGAFSNSTGTFANGATYTVLYNQNADGDGQLNDVVLSVVPEPNTLVFAALAMGAGLLVRRRRIAR